MVRRVSPESKTTTCEPSEHGNTYAKDRADRFVLLTRKVPIVIRYSCSIHPSFREREYLQKDFFLIYRHFENFIWLLKILLEIFLRDNCKSWKYLYSG